MELKYKELNKLCKSKRTGNDQVPVEQLNSLLDSLIEDSDFETYIQEPFVLEKILVTLGDYPQLQKRFIKSLLKKEEYRDIVFTTPCLPPFVGVIGR